MANVGRKGKYNPEIVKEILTVINIGGTDKDAYEYVGINADTFYEWIKRYPEFSEQITHERLKGKVSMIRSIREQGKKDWRATAWYLERRYAQEFAQQLVIRVDPGDLAVLKQMGFATPAEAWLAFMQNAREEYAAPDADS